MVSGIPCVLGLRTRMKDPYLDAVFEAPKQSRGRRHPQIGTQGAGRTDRWLQFQRARPLLT